MAATPSYLSRVAVTTTASVPTSADLIGVGRSSDENSTADENDASYQGSRFKGFTLGRVQVEVPLSGDWDASDVALGRIKAAHASGNTIYVTVLFDGTTGTRYPVKIPSFSRNSPESGNVTFSATVKSVGAGTDVILA